MNCISVYVLGVFFHHDDLNNSRWRSGKCGRVCFFSVMGNYGMKGYCLSMTVSDFSPIFILVFSVTDTINNV